MLPYFIEIYDISDDEIGVEVFTNNNECKRVAADTITLSEFEEFAGLMIDEPIGYNWSNDTIIYSEPKSVGFPGLKKEKWFDEKILEYLNLK